MTRSELIRERRRVRLMLDSLPDGGPEFSAAARAREAKAAPLRARLAELDKIIGPVKFYQARAATASDRIIARRFAKCESMAMF